MRAVLRMVAVMALWTGTAHAASATDAAVRVAFEHYDEGWRTYDADKIVDAFAPAFDWTNEVGLRFNDKITLRNFLGRLFRRADFRMGKPGPLVIRSIRFIGHDVAVVVSSEETDGQKDSATGKIVAVLHTNELTVMQYQQGHWLIVSDLTSDEAHGI